MSETDLVGHGEKQHEDPVAPREEWTGTVTQRPSITIIGASERILHLERENADLRGRLMAVMSTMGLIRNLADDASVLP